MNFENGYYVYNEKEEQIPLTVDKDTKLYIPYDESDFLKKVDESEFRKGVQENRFDGYYTIYIKGNKVLKVFPVDVP